MAGFDILHFSAPQTDFSQDFREENQIENIVPAAKASRDALWAGFATNGPFNPDQGGQIFNEYLSLGHSPTADAIVTDDQSNRTFKMLNSIKLNIENSLTPPPTPEQEQKAKESADSFARQLEPITTANTRRMNAIADLDRFNIIRAQGAPPRSLQNIALDYQRRRQVAQSTGEQFIQDQLVNTADMVELGPSELLNVERGTPRTREFLTTPQREEIARQMFGLSTEEQNGFLRTITNFAISGLVPGPYTIKQNVMLARVFPEVDEWTPGQEIEQAKNILRGLPRDELIQRLTKLSEVAKDMAGYGALEVTDRMVGDDPSFDSLQAYDLYSTYAANLAGAMSETTAAGINDATFLMDLFPAASYLYGKGKGIARYLKRFTPLSQLERTNRSAARELAQKIIRAKDEGDTTLAESLRVQLGEMVAQHGTVQSPGSGSRGNFSIIDDFDITQNPNAATLYSASYLTPNEYDAFVRGSGEAVRAETRTAAERASQVQVSNTEAQAIPGGIRVAHSLGASQHAGFHHPDVAEAVASNLADGERLVTIEARHTVTGQTQNFTLPDFQRFAAEARNVADDPNLNAYQRAAAQGETNNYEFFVRSQEDRYVSPEHVLRGEADLAREGVTGWAAKYLNKSSLYRRYFSNISNIAEAEADTVTQALRGAREEYSNLNSRSMKLADRVIHAMDQEGKNFTLAEIIDRTEGDVLAARGVLAVRRWADALHFRENANLRRTLSAEGYQSLDLTNALKERTRFLARPTENVTDGVMFYDSTTGKSVKANDNLLEDLKNRGYQFVELRRPVIKDKQEIRYIAIDPDKKGGRLNPLPKQVVPKLDGYFPRVYDANYMVVRITSGVDAHGRPFEGREPLSLHHNIDQANRDMRARQALKEDGKDELRVFGSRELDELKDEYLLSTQGRNSVDYYEASGRMFTTARGKQLNPLGEQLDANFRGPFRSIRETMEIAEHKVGNRAIQEAVDFLTNRWEKDNAEHFGVVDDRTGKKIMPIWGKLPAAKDANINRERYAAAVADRDHIQLVAGVDRTWMRTAWANTMRNVSESLVTRYSPDSWRYRVGDRALRLKNTGIDSMLRRGAFVYSIAWNPLRQLILQASSSALYTSAPNFMKYMTSGSLTKDYMAVVTYNLVKDLPNSNELIDQWAKRLNMSGEDYRNLGESFERTGFFQSIDSHSYAVGIHNSAYDQAFETSRAMHAIGQPLKNMNNFLRRVGFDTGEKHNLLTAFLVQRNEYLQEGKNLKELNTFAQLIGDARARSGNMSRTGATALNRGAAGVLFQFMTYNMRVAQMLIPKELPRSFGIRRASNFFTRGKAESWYKETIGKLSDNMLTSQEKKRIWLYQSLMWGAGGWGAMGAVNGTLQIISDKTGTPIELPPEVSNTIQEGMIGSGLNYGLRIAMGDNSQVNFSEAFSPVAGFRGNFPGLEEGNSNPLVSIGEALFLQTPSARQGLGPGVAMLFRAYSSLKTAWAMMGMPVDGVSMPYDPENSPDLALDAIARFAPSYNNFVRGRAAARIGWLTDNSGNLTVSAERGEAVMRALFGLESDRERSYLNDRNEIYGVTSVVTPASDRDIRDAAKTYYNNRMLAARRLGAGEISENQFILDAQNESGMLDDVFSDPVDNYNFWNYFQDYVRSDLNKNGEMKLADTLFSRIQEGSIKNNASSITRISNMGEFEGKEDVLNYLKTLTELYPND